MTQFVFSFSGGVKGQGMGMNRNPMGGNASNAGSANLASNEVPISPPHTL